MSLPLDSSIHVKTKETIVNYNPTPPPQINNKQKMIFLKKNERPVGLGAYHTGVEIYGTEYNFGGHSGSSSGIFEVSPKNAPGYIFRETILLGETNLSRREVEV